MKKPSSSTLRFKEKVILVIADLKSDAAYWPITDMQNEMEQLVIACGGEVIETLICRVHKPSASNLIGEGKLAELEMLCKQVEVDTVVFSHDLKGSHQRNIEEAIKVKTIDRTQLILDIFARRATSLEGKIQVELAQLEYMMPRLVGKGIELSRLGGGIGTLGPGETKLEVDRRKISQRITRLQRDLKDIASARALKRKRRQDKGVPAISLVGYTNAGKSTLLNTLTDARQVTKDGLFTTLDPLSRQFTLPNHQKVIVSDTVGFMHALPHHLIESFKATLEEVKEADLLIHVLDISNPSYQQLHEAVMDVLHQLDAGNKPMITVLNKIDKVTDPHFVERVKSAFREPVCISALKNLKVSDLLKKIEDMLNALYVEIQVDIPIQRMDLVNLAHEEGEVSAVKYYNDHIHLRVSLPAPLVGKFYAAEIPA